MRERERSSPKHTSAERGIIEPRSGDLGKLQINSEPGRAALFTSLLATENISALIPAAERLSWIGGHKFSPSEHGEPRRSNGLS
jgi:hypothetical protein